MEIICYLPQEREFLPWHAASRCLYQLDKLLDRTDEYSVFSVGRAVVMGSELMTFSMFTKAGFVGLLFYKLPTSDFT